MKPILIDNSLYYIKQPGLIDKKLILCYHDALIEAGVKYIEVNSEIIFSILEEDLSNYIFKVKTEADIELANIVNVPYVVVPMRYYKFIKKINKPIILEAELSDEISIDIIPVICDIIDLSKVSLLRIIGNFDCEYDKLYAILQKYKKHCAVPIDICPKNERLMGLNGAISAFLCDINSITLCFGKNENFASLEDFLISMHTFYRIEFSKHYIAGICKAAIFYSAIFGISSTGLRKLIDSYQIPLYPIVNVDKSLNLKPLRAVKPLPPKMSVKEKMLSELNLEKEVEEKVKKVLDDFELKLYDKTKSELNYIH